MTGLAARLRGIGRTPPSDAPAAPAGGALQAAAGPPLGIDIPKPPAGMVGLTQAELVLLAKLSSIWEDFVHLPIPSSTMDGHFDRQRMQAGIHELRALIMARAARRAHPGVFR